MFQQLVIRLIQTQLIKVIDYLSKGLENKTQVDCVSLDFSRAFDTVPQERLLLKMRSYGIQKLIPWFRDFLSMRDQIVIVNGAKSRIVKMLSGIVQGSCTAALCFLIFINDLPECVTQSFTGLFCDDTLLAKEFLRKIQKHCRQISTRFMIGQRDGG